MQPSCVIEGLDWVASHLLTESVSKRGGSPVKRLSLVGPSSQLGCRGRNLGDARPSQHGPRPPGSRCPFDAQSGGRRLRRGRSQARLSGKREGVPSLSERSCEFRYVAIPVIGRRRDAQTLGPAGNGWIVDRLDINAV